MKLFAKRKEINSTLDRNTFIINSSNLHLSHRIDHTFILAPNSHTFRGFLTLSRNDDGRIYNLNSNPAFCVVCFRIAETLYSKSAQHNSIYIFGKHRNSAITQHSNSYTCAVFNVYENVCIELVIVLGIQ